MPVYDYKCPTCGKTRTVTLSLKDDEVTQRCSCGQDMHRTYGLGAIQFKGKDFASNNKH